MVCISSWSAGLALAAALLAASTRPTKTPSVCGLSSARLHQRTCSTEIPPADSALYVVVCTVSPHPPARMRVPGRVLQAACPTKVTFTLENGFGAQV